MEEIIKLLNDNDIHVITEDDNEGDIDMRDGDIICNDKTMFLDIINTGNLGAGESYMYGKWCCYNDRLDILVYKIQNKNIQNQVTKPKSWPIWLWGISTYLFNYQTRSKAYDVENIHYNIGNELYQNMLGPSMAYTCAYYKNGNTDLDQAQYDKFQLICDKILLDDNDNVLDIGCGFGTLAKYMVEHKKCQVTGINISREQLRFAYNIQDTIKDNDIKSRLLYVDRDYRDIKGRYNKIVSIGLCEHVGYKNYRSFFEKVYQCLEDDGIFLLHTIGSNESVTCTDAWSDKYIFPGGMLPSIKQIGEAMEGLFILEDLQNFGPDYDKTLQAWYKNYKDAICNNRIVKDDIFNRMWEYYLLSSAGSFRARKMQLWQFVFTKNRKEKYTGIR